MLHNYSHSLKQSPKQVDLFTVMENTPETSAETPAALGSLSIVVGEGTPVETPSLPTAPLLTTTTTAGDEPAAMTDDGLTTTTPARQVTTTSARLVGSTPGPVGTPPAHVPTPGPIKTPGGLLTTPFTPHTANKGFPLLQSWGEVPDQHSPFAAVRPDNYPQHQGYPPQHPQGYPPQHPQGYPPQQPQGYPPQHPQGYPPQHPQGYPPQQPQGYPPQQHQGYPPQQPQGYPPQQHQGYPPQQPQGYQQYNQHPGYPSGYHQNVQPPPVFHQMQSPAAADLTRLPSTSSSSSGGLIEGLEVELERAEELLLGQHDDSSDEDKDEENVDPVPVAPVPVAPLPKSRTRKRPMILRAVQVPRQAGPSPARLGRVPCASSKSHFLVLSYIPINTHLKYTCSQIYMPKIFTLHMYQVQSLTREVLV